MPTSPHHHRTAPPRRSPSRLGRDLARAGLALSMAMLGLNLLASLPASSETLDPRNTLTLAIQPRLGDSSTEVGLTLVADDNVCPGDTETGNYRWNTFMVSASVNVATLFYTSEGPIKPKGAMYASPLFRHDDLAPIVEMSTETTSRRIVGIPTVGFGGLTPGQVAAGTYKVGFACTRATTPGQPSQTERYWQMVLTIGPSETGGPAKFVWTTDSSLPPVVSTSTTAASAVATTTSTTAAPTTSVVAASTTVGPSTTISQTIGVGVGNTTTTTSTTTTVAGSTTTFAGTTTTSTVAGSTTTSTLAGTTTTVLVASGAVVPSGGSSAGVASSAGVGSSGVSASGVSTGSSSSTSSSGRASPLPITGASGIRALLLWGASSVVCGALVMVTSRPRTRRLHR